MGKIGAAGENFGALFQPHFAQFCHCGVEPTSNVLRPLLEEDRHAHKQRWAAEDGFLDNRVVGGGPEDGWVGLTLNT